ncbi:G-type lectin S-receptor-like serine/threonine-protein kinase RKS1 [Linum perenne]
MEAAEVVLLVFTMLVLCNQTSCISNDTISATNSIRDGSLVISKGGKFALGFFSPGSSHYRYLGIWYYEIPDMAVVWVANRDSPISGTSGILRNRGYCDLDLYSNDSSEDPVWSSGNVGLIKGCEAQLLDSGNLVVMNGRNIVWQSFDYPTDTLLPGMKVGMNRRTGSFRSVTSWRSVDDPGTGEFSHKLNPNGSPQFFLYRNTVPYWRSVPWPWHTTLGFLKDHFVNGDEGIYYSNSIVNSSVHVKLIVDPSGLFELATWDGDDRLWKVVYSSPKQKCDYYGTCGPYAKCYTSIVFPYECDCLPGYEPRYRRKWDLRDRSGGCVRKRSKSGFCGIGEGFVRVDKVKIPDTSTAVWMDVGKNKMKCEEECRKNCSCSAYATLDADGEGTSCWTWQGELLDTVQLSVDAYDLFVRVDSLELADYLRDSNGFIELRLKLSIIIPSIVSVWLVVILLGYIWFRKWKRRRVKNRRIRSFFHQIDGSSNHLEDSLAPREIKRSSIYPDLPFFGFSTICKATDGFSPKNKIGQGGFGSVYKGKLSNGQEVAVKRLSRNSREGLEQFKNEVMLIAKLQHRNLVKLHGCCIEEDEQMLVYEYLPCNSLDSLLFGKSICYEKKRSTLDWRKRFNIIVGVARGILYLHQDSRFRIIHRDLKPGNVLLDAELNPKISDFGMARVLESDQVDGKTSRVCGTYGYMSPEYVIFGRYSVKLDVFSFGVILLETVTGKKINGFFHDDPLLSLIGHVWELWREGRAIEAIDPSISIKDSNEVLRCIEIGLLCVEENATDRPDMLAVVLMLNSVNTPVPSPKKPAFVVCVKPKLLLGEEQTCSINDMSFSGILSR